MRDLADGRQPSEDMSAYRVVRAGDLVVNKLWARFGAYGTALNDGIISPAYWVLTPDSTTVVPRYLHYLLRSSEFLTEIGRISKNLPPNGYDLPWLQFRKMELPLPDLKEQRRIADFLDAETSRIDDLVGRRRSQLGLFSEREQSVVDTHLVRKSDQRVALGRFARIQTGVTVDGGRDLTGALERPYLRVANVKADGLDLRDVKTISVDPSMARRSELRPGDVLMTEGGDIDKLGRGTVWRGEIDHCLHQNHVFAVRTTSELVGDYLALATRTSLARSYFEMTGSKTTNLASTSSSKILAFKVPLPPAVEQIQRVKSVQNQLERMDRLRNVVVRQIDLLAERRQALITAAVTGQLDVTTARSGVRA